MLRKLSLAVSAAMATGVFGVASAQATPDDVAACGVAGQANITSSSDGSNPPAVPIHNAGDTNGTYRFTQFVLTCAGADANDPTSSVPAVLNVNTSGNWDQPGGNFCGHGTADSTTSTIVSSTPSNAEFNGATVPYHIDFNGGVGTLRWTGGTDGDGGPIGSNGIDGAIDITPTPPTPPNATDCAVGFQVAGIVTVTATDSK
jgi:hypothetical protein